MLGAAVIAPGYGGAAELIDEEDQLIDTSGSTLKSLIEKAYFDEKRLERMRKRSLERSQNYLGTHDYIEKFLEIAEEVTRKG